MGQTLWYSLGIWGIFNKGHAEEEKREDSGFYSVWDEKPLEGKKLILKGQIDHWKKSGFYT